MTKGEYLPLVCPRCSGELSFAEPSLGEPSASLRCRSCACRFPQMDGIPCLVPEPTLWLAQWRSRLSTYAALLDARVAALRQDCARPGLLARTRSRVARIVRALVHERSRVDAFRCLVDEGEQTMGTALPWPSDQSDARAVLDCDEHLFRDWVWGGPEIDRLRTFAESLLTPGPIGLLAVYGAGAGRLAFDVHRSLAPAQTIAFDCNPLPLWVAGRLLKGEVLQLFELPLWPSRDEDVVILRELRCVQEAPPGFTLVIADALQPPFAAGAVDLVFTCWFIDAVAADLRALIAAIHRVLRPGGVWLNVGPLRFQTTVSGSYTVEEVHELVEEGGFALVTRDQAALPYFASPAGGTHATEVVFGFAARRLELRGRSP